MITTEQISDRIVAAIATFGPEREAVTLDATFEALDVDSLDMVELSQIVHDEYGVQITSDDMPKLRTVADAVELVAARAS